MSEDPRRLRRPTQARAKEKVHAILDATEVLLEGIPAAELVMRDVARRAGVKPATLYDYFPTKELLLRALEDRAWARAAEKAQRVVDVHAPLGTRDEPRLATGIARLVETFMTEMTKTARTVGLTATSPFGREGREVLGSRFAALAAKTLHGTSGQLRDADLSLRMNIAIEAVAMLTFVAARDHATELADGTYAREVGRMIAHYFVRDA